MLKLHHNERTTNEEEARLLMEIGEEKLSEQSERFRKIWYRMSDTSEKGIFEELEWTKKMDPRKTFAIIAPRNEAVNRLNEYAISRMVGVNEVRSQHMKISEEGEKFKVVQFFPRKLVLAPGCKIVLYCTIEKGFVNGLMGVVVQIDDLLLVAKSPNHPPKNLEMIGFPKEKIRVKMYWRQFPVREAEVMTVHNTQGRTFDGVIFVSKGLFTPGLAYTAISRARSLKLCRLSCMNFHEWTQTSEAKEAYLEKLRRKRPHT